SSSLPPFSRSAPALQWQLACSSLRFISCSEPRGNNPKEGDPMRVSEAMTREVRVASPGQSIRDVAKIMAEIDAGSMPVGDNDRLVGMITDRDIAIRAVALGKGPETPVREVMSSDQVLYCYEDEE